MPPPRLSLEAAKPSRSASVFAMRTRVGVRASRAAAYLLASCVGLWFAALTPVLAAKNKFNKEPPVWQIDLKDFYRSNHIFQNCTRCTQIAFLSEDLLAVTFQTSEPAPIEPGRGVGVSSGPNGYRTVLFDVRTGLIRGTHDWTIPRGPLTLIPTHDGKFLAKTLSEVELYSSSFEKLQSQKLSDWSLPPYSSVVEVSWDGRRIVIATEKEWELTLRLIDTDSFAVVGTWTRPVNSHFVLVAAGEDVVAYRTEQGISVVSNSRPADLASAPFHPCLLFEEFAFVNADAIASTCYSELQVSDLRGNGLFQVKFSFNQVLLSPTSSRSGARLGLKIVRPPATVGALFMLGLEVLTPAGVIIFDTKTWRILYERGFGGNEDQPIADFALSPEDSYLAILSKGHRSRSDGVIQLFRPPPTSSSVPASSPR